MTRLKKEYHVPSELPIYKVTYNILRESIHIMVHMRKDVKHTIGQKLINLSLEALSTLNTSFYSPKDKRIAVRQYIALIDNIEQLVNICIDSYRTSILSINDDDYVRIMPYIANAKKQGIGWYNSFNPIEDKIPESIIAENNGV